MSKLFGWLKRGRTYTRELDWLAEADSFSPERRQRFEASRFRLSFLNVLSGYLLDGTVV